MKKNILLLLLLSLVILSCEKEEKPSLVVNKTEYTVSDAADIHAISFDSNMNWTAKSSASWCTITRSTGEASVKSVTVAVATNDTFDDRSCTVTIAVGALSKTVTITQSANLGLFVSKDKFELSNAATSIEVDVESNIEYEVTLSDKWITRNNTRGLSTKKLLFNIAKNDSYDNREGSIVITHKGGTLSKTIMVYQSQVDAIILSSKTENVTSENQILKVELKTNVDFEVIIPASGKSWVSYTTTRALRNETLLLNISRNPKAEVRSTEIYVKNKATTLQDTLTIIQAAGTNVLVIEGSANAIQHIDVAESFMFRLNNLEKKDVYFVFSNQNLKGQTPMPKIQGNVAQVMTPQRNTSVAQSSFIVSGKPSITEFNNNARKHLKKGMSQPQFQKNSTIQPEKYVEGNSESFYDDKGKAQLSTVRKVISAHGKNLYMWVADNCWGPESSKTYHVTQQMVDEFAPKFLNSGADNDIYEWVTNAAGAPWGETPYSNLIPDTDDIHIWLTDIDDDNKTSGTITLGYYYARDNFMKVTYPDSNEKLMFTIDAVLFGKTTNGVWNVKDYWPMQFISTLSHEFTHMIYFYQKSILTAQEGNTAINEMCAQCVEDLVANKILSDGPRGIAYGTSNSGTKGLKDGRLPLYNSHNYYNLLDWSDLKEDVLINYSKTYALGAYLMRNYGGANLIKQLIQNDATGAASIVEAVNANGGAGLTYGDILQRFGAANLLSDQTTVSAWYRFNTGTWSTSTVNGINYELGSINLFNYSPAPYIYNELPTTQRPNSNIYYKAGTNLSGQKEWFIEGMSEDIKLTVVIK